MAIQTRRGNYPDFDPNKMLPGEWATVLTGDPGSDDGMAIYMCFMAGIVKRMATYDDMVDNVRMAAGDAIAQQIDAATGEAVAACNTATQEANKAKEVAKSAASEANRAASEADAAKSAANAATNVANSAAARAEAAAAGDIAEKTVTFQEAAERANIQSGDSMATALGKLAKLYADLDDHAYCAPINNLDEINPGKALDAYQGKVISDNIAELKSGLPKIANVETTISSVPSGSNTACSINLSSLNASSIKAVIPYVLGGIPLPISVNGITNETINLFVRNDTGSTLTNRTIKAFVFYN